MDEKPTVGDRIQDSDDEGRGLARTPRGRLLLSGFLLLVLTAVLVSVMPNSAIRSSVLPVARPFQYVTGLDQRWGVFAPNPPRDSSYVFARIQDADGTASVRTIPVSVGVSEYWNYRWLKYGETTETARNDAASERATFARWLVDQAWEAGGRPVRVTLLRHTRTSLPPGPGPDYGPWREVAFYSSAVNRL